jgi:RNA polymerase sigma factor (sigma-70 family)
MIALTMAPRNDPSELRTPVSLILRLNQGTPAEWRTFWDIYAPVVYRLAVCRGLDHHDAQDVVGVVMRSLHARIRRGLKIDHGKGRFRGYLARTTQRAVTVHRRRFGRSASGERSLASAADGADSPAEDLAKMERLERLRLCLDRLRASSKVRRRDVEAFERYVLQGEPAEVVARLLGLSRGRVFGIRTEMIERIRKMLIELDIELGEV